MGDDLPFLQVEDAALLLQSRDDALDRSCEIRERNGVGAAARRDQRRFVDKVGQIGAGKTRRQGGDLVEIGVRRQR